MLEICRLCMGKRLVNQKIFGPGGIHHQIKACLPIEISESDNLPKKICKECVTSLRVVYTYCQKTVNVQKQLLKSNRDPLESSNDEDKNIEDVQKVLLVKEESTEDISKQSDNQIIETNNEKTETSVKNMNIVSKYTQTELRMCDLEFVTKNRDEMCQDEDDLKNIMDQDKSSPGLKAESSCFMGNNDDYNIDHCAMDSDNDLPLSHFEEFKDKSLKNKCTVDKTIIKSDRSKKRKKKNIILDTKVINSDLGTKYVKKNDISSGNVVFKEIKLNLGIGKMSKQEMLLHYGGEQYFYPAGTPEELKKWQCLTCFVFVKSQRDLLEHYNEHEYPSKFLPKTEKALNDTKTSLKAVTEATDRTILIAGGEPEQGIDFCIVNNPNFSDTSAYQCLKCLKMFQNKRVMIRHITNHNNTKPFPCNKCGAAYKTALEIFLHGRVHNGSKTLTCEHPGCNYKTVYKGYLNNHMKRHETGRNTKYTCDVCNKGFDILTWYNEHKNEHLGVKPFTCDVCGKSFVYSRYLRTHRRCVHPESVEKSDKKLLYQCPSCPKQFFQWRNLKAHEKREHEAQRVPGDISGAAVICDICGMGLSSKDQYKHHRRTHTGEKPFECRTCGKEFASKNYLTIHERVHSGEKPHVCSQCGKAYTQRSTLVIHMRYHTGARPYTCTICNKGFVSKGLLSMHQKTSCI